MCGNTGLPSPFGSLDIAQDVLRRPDRRTEDRKSAWRAAWERRERKRCARRPLSDDSGHGTRGTEDGRWGECDNTPATQAMHSERKGQDEQRALVSGGLCPEGVLRAIASTDSAWGITCQETSVACIRSHYTNVASQTRYCPYRCKISSCLSARFPLLYTASSAILLSSSTR